MYNRKKKQTEMEHLQRIIPKIDVLHGLPGVLSTSGLTFIYINYLRTRVEKYQEILQKISEYRNVSVRLAIEFSNYSLHARPHLPREIIEILRKYVLELKNVENLGSIVGLYSYVLQNCTHIPEINKNLVSMLFDKTYEGVQRKIVEGVQCDLSVFLDVDNGILHNLLIQYRRHKWIDQLWTPAERVYKFNIYTIPFDSIIEYANVCGQSIDNFAPETIACIKLCRNVRNLNLQLEGCLAVKIDSIPELQDSPPFTYNARWHNITHLYPNSSTSYFWRVNHGDHFLKYRYFKELCVDSDILNVGNLEAVKIAVKLHPTKLAGIKWILEQFNFFCKN